MPTYAGSRLAATGKVTGEEKRAARRALDKRIRTALNEKLMMEVEMSIPQDVTDIRADKERVAEVVVKLMSKLKQGPLIEAKTDEQRLNGAIEFLVTNLGKTWMRSWFQPHTVESSSTSVVSVRDGSDIMPCGTTPPVPQLLELPAGTISYSLASEGSAARIESLQPVLDSISIQLSAPEAAISSTSANEVIRALARLGPGTSTSRYQRSHSDPGQVHMCLVCYRFHWTSKGSPRPAVFPSSEATSTVGDTQFQRTPKNESWTIWMMRHVLTSVNAVAWLLFRMFLVLLSKSYSRN